MIHSAIHFISHYGYAGIFILLGLGMLGIPIPEETLLTFTGFLVSTGKLNYSLTFLFAFLGSTVGMSFSFSVGKYLGLPFIEKHGKKFGLTKKRMQKTEKWFNKFGKFTVTFGYFIPGLRHFTAYIAGISNWSYRTFLLYALPGGLVWTATFLTLGFLLGNHWHVAVRLFDKYMWDLLIVFIAVAIIGLFYRKKNLKKVIRKKQD